MTASGQALRSLAAFMDPAFRREVWLRRRRGFVALIEGWRWV